MFRMKISLLFFHRQQFDCAQFRQLHANLFLQFSAKSSGFNLVLLVLLPSFLFFNF